MAVAGVSGPRVKKVPGLLWLLYSVLSQLSLRATEETRTSSMKPSKGLSAPLA